MNQIKHADLILDAIDQLRRRKARPDAERIYNCLFRRKGVGSTESKIALEKCVASGVVLRVSYKGNISYRNASKKYARQGRSSESDGNGNGNESHNTSAKPRRKFNHLLTNAYAELVLQEPDYLDMGIPPSHLITTILKEKLDSHYTKSYLWKLLKKEVESGGLVQLDNGNYLVGKPPSLGAKSDVLAPQDYMVRLNKGDDEGLDEGEYEERNRRNGDVSAAQKSASNTTNAASGGHAIDVRSNNIVTAANKNRSTAGDRRGFNRKGVHSRVRPTLKTSRLAVNMKHHLDDQRNDNLRVGGRRKKAKKVFDPSESNMPKRRGRPLGSTKGGSYKFSKGSDGTDSRPESRTSQNGRAEGGVCSVCRVQNKKGPAEKLISCRECSNKAHASCLNGDDMMLKMYPDNTWQCPHCKTCVVCFETSDAGNLVVCSICADAYHYSCHAPEIIDKLKPSSKWCCNNCQMSEHLSVGNIQIGFNMESKLQNGDESTSAELSRNSSPHFISSPSSPTLPTLSPQMTHNGHHSSSESDSKSDIHSLKDEDVDENIDPSIPDATNWTTDEVCNYFAQYFPDEAPVFREQEIDGHSLLMMTRMDVLKGLCLKVGPALKIYRHVLKLQYRRDDPKLYWV